MMADKALLGTGIFAKKADSITCEAEFIMIERRKLRLEGIFLHLQRKLLLTHKDSCYN
jgi:hypothetical protein